MNVYRVFLSVITLITLILVCAYYLLFYYQMGAPLAASYDLKNWIRLKESAASKIHTNKILLVADSNVLFGFDSEYAEKILKKPVVNMGLHGGLPLDWILEIASRNSKKGDIVVLPLYFGYYLSDYRKPNPWILDQVIAWNSDYYNKLSLLRKIHFLKALSFSRLLDNINTQWRRNQILQTNPLRLLPSKKDALKIYDNMGGTQTSFSYSYLNMNSHGDMLNTCGSQLTFTGASYTLPNKIIDKASINLIAKVTKDLQDRGVTVYFTASVLIDDSITRSKEFQKMLNNIWLTLKKKGIPTLGNPTDYFFPQDAFFNSAFHLNCKYNLARTIKMVNRLNEVRASSTAY